MRLFPVAFGEFAADLADAVEQAADTVREMEAFELALPSTPLGVGQCE